MRGSTGAYRLIFLLPDSIAFAVAVGRHQPCLLGCRLEVDAHGRVTVEGPSRGRVIDQVIRFIQLVARDHPPTRLAATLTTPATAHRRGGTDSYWIIVNVKVAVIAGVVEPTL